MFERHTFQPEPSQPVASQIERQPQMVIPGREFPAAQDFARFLREGEVVWLHGIGMQISE